MNKYYVINTYDVALKYKVFGALRTRKTSEVIFVLEAANKRVVC